jgi:DNA-3-methyladenine glycosylase II
MLGGMQTAGGLHEVHGRLRPAAPFAFDKSVAFVCGFAATEGEQAVAGAGLTKAFRVEGHTALVDLAGEGTVDEPVLRWRFRARRPLPAPSQRQLLARVRFYLGTDEVLADFYRIGRGDPGFAPVIRRLRGYHQVKFASPFENACWAVLTQRCPLPVARRMKDALVARFGGAIDIDGRTHHAFPEPADLRDATGDELAAVIGNPVKARRIAAVTAAFAGVDPAFLREGTIDDVRGWLTAIDGIGPWSASFVLVRGLGRTESIAGFEEMLIPVVAASYGLATEDTTAADVRRLAARYGCWQGYWAHYLRVAASAPVSLAIAS